MGHYFNMNSYDIIVEYRGHRKKKTSEGRDLNPLPPDCHARTLPAGAVMIATYSTPELYGFSTGSRMVHSSIR